MAKKITKPTKGAATKAQKSTNARKTSTKTTRKGKAENKPKTEGEGKRNIPVLVGGDHATFATQKKKFAMLKALTNSLGIVTPAAQMVGIARKTHYRWIEDDPEYKAMVEDILELQFDFVETKLLENVRDGNVAAQIWYTKTKMKSRGYVERVEVEHIEKPSFVIDESNKGSAKIMDIVHKKNNKTGTND